MKERARGQTLCIGTSPAMLLYGLRLATRGQYVCFMDRADDIGGAWRTRNLFGCSDVEIGVHLVENRRASNNALAQLVGSGNLIYGSLGFGLVRGKRIPLLASRIILHSGLAVKAAVRMDTEGLIAHASRSASALLELQTPCVYSAGGFSTVLRELQSRLLSLQARFMMGREALEIELTPTGVRVSEHAETHYCERVVISSRGHAPVVGRHEQLKEIREATLSNFVFVLPNHTLKFRGYVEIFQNPVMKRIRELGSLGVTSPQGEIVVAQSRASPGGDDGSAALEKLLSEMRRLQLIERGATALLVHKEIVSVATLSRRSLKKYTTRLKVGSYAWRRLTLAISLVPIWSKLSFLDMSGLMYLDGPTGLPLTAGYSVPHS